MANQVFNFGAGPAMLPVPVMEKIQTEFLNYNGMGVSAIEISHRSKEFVAILEAAQATFRELSGVPDNYKILFVHGGARMQFAAIPLNLAGRTATKKCLYFETGNFAKLAHKDAVPFCNVKVVASGAATNHDRLPPYSPADIDQDAAYCHITSNNTVYGSQWQTFPDTGAVPLIADQTSEILSREIDYSKFGCIYAGMQKNLGPSGMAMVVIREDLLGFASEQTPLLLNYTQLDKDNSLTNTTNTFAIYVVKLMLDWLKAEGGVKVIEARNRAKAAHLYALLDGSGFYKGFVQPEFRSMMNVTFNLASEELEAKFLKEAGAAGLYALKGHRAVNGIRASIYNPMPMAGVEALASFMEEFERKNG
ncbi:MAG: 3-phosphoserine/phosphohydroxythreonine transaminase [Desulfuromonadaceae bacterium]|nr:3-phosphoserine/phosphohydroxythreonine transaminase [Desulfuromonadaceae bacterium]